MSQTAIAIHGGAGNVQQSIFTPEIEAAFHEGLKEALLTGNKILSRGGTALEAVEAAVVVLEDNPLFNAGKGSVLNHEGKVEMDASIMCGKTFETGALAAVSGIKNPVKLARIIMQHSQHVLLCGEGAVNFGRLHEIVLENEDYFMTEIRKKQWEKALKNETISLDHSSDDKLGTVGAVALDKNGNLAAATSTGGMTNKKFGRIGDTPLIGAGNYADNKSCAVSCTGHGEYMIKTVLAYRVAALMEYAGYDLEKAAREAVFNILKQAGGEGGLIAVDNSGNIAMPFNSSGMFRGSLVSGGEIFTAIF